MIAHLTVNSTPLSDKRTLVEQWHLFNRCKEKAYQLKKEMAVMQDYYVEQINCLEREIRRISVALDAGEGLKHQTTLCFVTFALSFGSVQTRDRIL